MKKTASAVPYSAVASPPALQWVRTPWPLDSSFAPCSPMARQVARSSSWIARASCKRHVEISTAAVREACSLPPSCDPGPRRDSRPWAGSWPGRRRPRPNAGRRRPRPARPRFAGQGRRRRPRRCRWPGPRGPAAADRLPDRFHVAAVDLDQLDGQARLVDHPQVAIRAADPVQGLRFHRDFRTPKRRLQAPRLWPGLFLRVPRL